MDINYNDNFIYFGYIEGYNYKQLLFFIPLYETLKNNGWIKTSLIKIEYLDNDNNKSVYNCDLFVRIYNGRFSNNYNNLTVKGYFAGGENNDLYLTKFYKLFTIEEYLNNNIIVR